MASTIILSDNGASSGSAGLKETGGNDGVLLLQTTTSGGTATTAVTIGSDQKVTFAYPPISTGLGNSTTNTVFGSGAFASNVSGIGNTIMGNNAGSLLTGSRNTFVGLQAGLNSTADGNTFIGAAVGYANTTGVANVGVGGDTSSTYTTLRFNTSGSYNTALGMSALANSVTASNNTAIGYEAGYSFTGGSNVAIGYQSFRNSSSNVAGVAVGSGALAQCTGSYNTAIGSGAGAAVTTGTGNSFVGINAGNNTTTGVNNVCVGSNNKPNAAGDNSCVVIGSDGTTGKGSATGFINPQGGGVYQGNNSSSWSVTSDRRLKKNIVDFTVGLEKILQLQVRNFEYRLPEEVEELEPMCAIEREGVQIGVIAQEIQQVLPDCVKQESTGVLSVDSDSLTWYLVNAIQEQQALITTLTERITALENK